MILLRVEVRLRAFLKLFQPAYTCDILSIGKLVVGKGLIR
jgi:hypothetical protein